MWSEVFTPGFRRVLGAMFVVWLTGAVVFLT